MHDGVDCRRLLNRLAAYLALDPGDGEAQRVRAHLAACPGCRAELGRWFILERWEEGRIAPSPAGAGLVRAVMERLEEVEATPCPSATRILKGKAFDTPSTSPPGALSESERGWPQAGGEVFTRQVEPKPVFCLEKPEYLRNPGSKAWGRERHRSGRRIFWNYLAAALATVLLLFGGFFDAMTGLALGAGRLREGIQAVDRCTQRIVEKGLKAPEARRDSLRLRN